MSVPQTQPAFDSAYAGHAAVGAVAVALNPVPGLAVHGISAGIPAALRMPLISWQVRFATHATPVRLHASSNRK